MKISDAGQLVLKKVTMLTGLPHQLFISYIKQAGVERRARTTIGLNRGFARSILIR